MQHMEESEFDKLTFTEKPANCRHHFVRLYDSGAHTDYGCVKCGFCTSTPEKYESGRDQL